MAIRLLLLLAILGSGCATLVVDPLEQLRDANKQNVAKLSGGLPEVLFGRVQYLQARNPMREERLVGTDGLEYEVLFYYTDLRERDDKITDDELTPVALQGGEVPRPAVISWACVPRGGRASGRSSPAT
jgi:hypothetical protein